MAQTQRATDYVQTPQLDPSAMEEGSVSQSSNSHSSRVRTLPLFSSSWTSVIGAALIAMLLGAPGGLLLGSLEVVTLICLESHLLPQVIIFAGPLYNSIVILSSAVGIIAGLVSYSLVIKMKGEGAAGKALALAGPVCLMVVTATGAALGAILFRHTWILYIIIGYAITLLVLLFMYVVFGCFEACQSYSHSQIYSIYDISIIEAILYILCGFMIVSFAHALFSSQTLMLLLSKQIIIFIPTSFVFEYLSKHLSIHFEILSVSIMCFTTETLLALIDAVTTLDTAASTVTVLGEFSANLTSQLLMVGIGMSLFVSWQTGGAVKICLAAAGSGTAVLGVIKAALPVLGPAASTGALMGVAGAVGVSLAAAGAAADSYGCGGRLGVTVGAAVGGFLASCAHSGLSGVFIGLCAAMIPFVHYCKFIITICYESFDHNDVCCSLLLTWTLCALLLLWLNYTNSPFLIRYALLI